MKPDFSFIWNLLKGGVGGVGGGALGAIMAWVIRVWNGGDSTLDPSEAAAFGAVLGWILLQGKNLIKQSNLGLAKYIPVLVCAVALSSCNTVGPAISGKTEIETSFTDTIGPDGVQNTQYNQKLKAPAGVEAKDLASMTYDWNADQSGSIAVSSDRSADTMGQAELLKAAFEANSQQINMLFGALIQAAGIASPLIGQKLDLDATDKARDDANSAARFDQAIKLMENISKRLADIEAAKPKPAAPPVDTPLVDLPVVQP
jgi:hypothetical protein